MTILGIPILHLTLTQSHPPWIQLLRISIAPIATEVCLNQAFAGRISLFQLNWKVLTHDHWVLQTVSEGYHIPLSSHPVQLTPPHNPHLSSKDQSALEDEVKALLQKQAIQHLSNVPTGFYSNMFMVPKKGGGQGPVINLKPLNHFVKSGHFKMEGLHTFKAPPKERLDGQNRPQRCILHGTNSPPVSLSPPFQRKEGNIPLQMSPIWLVYSPQSVHHNSQTGGGDIEVNQHASSYGTDLMQRRGFARVRVQVHPSSSGTTREYQCYYSRVRVPSL